MFIKLPSCLLVFLILIKYVASQRLFDINERRQDILAVKNEPYKVKKQQLPNDEPFRGRHRKTGDWWETAHDRLFGQPRLMKPSWNESDNTINRNLEGFQEELNEPGNKRRVFGGRIRPSSGSSMAVIIFMLVVVVSMAVVWMEVDFNIIEVLFRVVSLDDEDEERAIGRSSSRRSKKSKKKRKLSKSKRYSYDDNSDSESDSDLEARRKSKKKKNHRVKKHQNRNSEDSI